MARRTLRSGLAVGRHRPLGLPEGAHRADPAALVATQGHVLTVRDLAQTLVVEAALHHLDLVVRAGEILLYEDSYRNIALAINAGNAAEMLSARSGTELRIRLR